MNSNGFEGLVQIAVDSTVLEGFLSIPEEAESLVVFAHGSGSSRHSPRNNFVANVLRRSGIATLLLDLVPEENTSIERSSIDIDPLANRLRWATEWLWKQPRSKELRVGYFGASTGVAVALRAAAGLDEPISAIVSRGGRPDLASASLEEVRAPVLLIVGEKDKATLEVNSQAYEQLKSPKELVLISGATHSFDEPGALDEVALLANAWFGRHLGSDGD